MKFQIRVGAAILVAMFVGINGNASADAGPICIRWDNTCNLLRIFVTDNVIIYGQEIGCDPTHVRHSPVGGSANRAIGLGYDFSGDNRVYELTAPNRIAILSNSGTGLSPFNSGTFSVEACPRSGQAEIIPDSAADPND